LRTFDSPDKAPWAELADPNKRETWTIEQRLLMSFATVRHVTHAGPHADIGVADQAVARYTSNATGNILLYYTSRRQ
jgi:hypothetical protein